MEREHTFPTSADGGAQLDAAAHDLARALGADPRRPDDLAAAVARCEGVVEALTNDGNPRVRAQVRGLAQVLRLLRDGDEDGATELLSGELTRSFPGRADFSGVEGYLEDL